MYNRTLMLRIFARPPRYRDPHMLGAALSKTKFEIILVKSFGKIILVVEVY